MGKLAAAVWRGSSTEAGARASKIAATYTDGGNASVNAMGMAKSRVGKDILEDYKLVQMGHSAYFTGEPPPCPLAPLMPCFCRSPSFEPATTLPRACSEQQ